MPVLTCQKNGTSGHKWGRGGVCFIGTDSRARAAAVGRAIFAQNQALVPAVNEPTRTVTIRRAWIADVNRRYARLKRDIVAIMPRFRISVTNVEQFTFTSDPRAVLEFLAFLQTRIDDRIFDNITTPADMWHNVYIDRGYARGVNAAIVELRKQGIDIAATLPTITPATLVGTAVPSLGVVSAASFINNPIHLDAIQLLYTRDFAALKGITDEMSKQIARILTEGVEQGLGIRELTRNITDRVDKIGRTRSQLIARTETVRAYNTANINEGLSVAADTGETINQEWVTAGDERVRSTHAHRNGKIFEPNVARGLIGEPNCRCSLVPFIEKLDTEEDQEERTERREQGLARIDQNG